MTSDYFFSIFYDLIFLCMPVAAIKILKPVPKYDSLSNFLIMTNGLLVIYWIFAIYCDIFLIGTN